jgi:hypothetical protein
MYASADAAENQTEGEDIYNLIITDFPKLIEVYLGDELDCKFV